MVSLVDKIEEEKQKKTESRFRDGDKMRFSFQIWSFFFLIPRDDAKS